MPTKLSRAMREVARKECSTAGKQSNASQRIRQAIDPLDDPREERFVTLYVENPNGTQAAIAAGYSPRSAHTIAHRLLKRGKIKDAIARRNAELMVELDFISAADCARDRQGRRREHGRLRLHR